MEALPTERNIYDIPSSYIEGLLFNKSSLKFRWDINEDESPLKYVAIIIESGNHLPTAINTLIDIMSSTFNLSEENTIEDNANYGKIESEAVNNMIRLYEELQVCGFGSSLKINDILKNQLIPKIDKWRAIKISSVIRFYPYRRPRPLLFVHVFPFRDLLMNRKHKYTHIDVEDNERNIQSIKRMFEFNNQVRIKHKQLETVAREIGRDPTLIPLYKELSEELREFIDNAETKVIDKDALLENEKAFRERIRNERIEMKERETRYLEISKNL